MARGWPVGTGGCPAGESDSGTRGPGTAQPGVTQGPSRAPFLQIIRVRANRRQLSFWGDGGDSTCRCSASWVRATPTQPELSRLPLREEPRGHSHPKLLRVQLWGRSNGWGAAVLRGPVRPRCRWPLPSVGQGTAAVLPLLPLADVDF